MFILGSGRIKQSSAFMNTCTQPKNVACFVFLTFFVTPQDFTPCIHLTEVDYSSFTQARLVPTKCRHWDVWHLAQTLGRVKPCTPCTVLPSTPSHPPYPGSGLFPSFFPSVPPFLSPSCPLNCNTNLITHSCSILLTLLLYSDLPSFFSSFLSPFWLSFTSWTHSKV